ncbi:hypothetical protein, partial [Vibrio anguillarum]
SKCVNILISNSTCVCNETKPAETCSALTCRKHQTIMAYFEVIATSDCYPVLVPSSAVFSLVAQQTTS